MTSITSPQLPKDVFLIDTHCHLDMLGKHYDIEQLLQRSLKHNINHLISIGINVPSSKQAIVLAKIHPEVSATIGIHPHDIDATDQKDYLLLEQLYNDNSDYIVGYGEIGLDYVKKYSDPSKQRKHFKNQLDIANNLQLPVIIHNREADEDTLSILKQAKPLEYGGIMHCFSGTLEFSKKILELGLLISIPGIVTFKNAKTLQEVAQKIPLDTMVVETDAPFLAPHPYRGKQNEPSFMIHTAQKIADLRKCTINKVANKTTANAKELFNL